MKSRIIPAIFVLAIASLACSFNVDLGEAPTPGPDIVDAIDVPAPSAGPLHLSLTFGAGELHLAPGAGDRLLSGTATYNIADFKPEVTQNGGDVLVKQGDYEFSTAPTLHKFKNVWDLKLGNQPMDLAIQAGAYQGRMDLGGLSLTDLTVQDGAADVKLSFSEPNPAEMSVLRYETGASDVTLEGLGNANFNTMIFRSGAGNYTLDFSGELQRDGIVTVESGLGNLTLVIPEGVKASVTAEGGLSNITADSGWSQNGHVYTQEGQGPSLTLVVRMSAGNLTISH